MKTVLVQRSFEVYALPVTAEISLLHPERVVLQYYKSHSIDIGALCYLRRNMANRRAPGQGRLVDLSSFDSARASQVRTLISLISECFANGTKNVHSIDTSHRHFTQFIDWCDIHGHRDVLANESSGHSAFRAYVEHLRRLVAQHQLNNNTAAQYQNHCSEMLELTFDTEHMSRGVNVLFKRAVFDTPTSVPSDDVQGKVIAWCHSLFHGLSELVVEEKPYPFALTAPNYLKCPDNRLWVFPSTQWCKSPLSAYDFKKVPLDYAAYDYANGSVFSLEALLSTYGPGVNRLQLIRIRWRALSHIRKANADSRFRNRIDRGLSAIRFFLILFIAATGMNPSQVLSLAWSAELDEALTNPLIERQGFRTIKYRANSKVVSFEIGAKFLPVFRRYLELRQFLLQGRTFDLLFFGYMRSNLSNPVATSTGVFASVYKHLNQLDPSVPKVMPREWRAAKQDHLVRNVDPYTAARSMQHSLRTALKKYSNGSEVVHQQEIGAYLRQVEQVVLGNGATIEGGEIRSIGFCAYPNHPVPIIHQVPVFPDCKGPEGCLFCNQYRVHADETDTRKLLSCRYCVQKTSHLANSQEQFEQVFGAILNRIDFVLNKIRSQDARLVAKIEQEVDVDGELSAYWATKLEMLMELELI